MITMLELTGALITLILAINWVFTVKPRQLKLELHPSWPLIPVPPRPVVALLGSGVLMGLYLERVTNLTYEVGLFLTLLAYLILFGALRAILLLWQLFGQRRLGDDTL